MPKPLPPDDDRGRARARRWRGGLLLLWAIASFGVSFFARELTQVVAGWPINYWWMGQGGVLLFIAIVAAYAWVVNRGQVAEADEPPDD